AISEGRDVPEACVASRARAASSPERTEPPLPLPTFSAPWLMLFPRVLLFSSQAFAGRAERADGQVVGRVVAPELGAQLNAARHDLGDVGALPARPGRRAGGIVLGGADLRPGISLVADRRAVPVGPVVDIALALVEAVEDVEHEGGHRHGQPEAPHG